MANRSALAAVLESRCPRCREGKLFEYHGLSAMLPGRFDKMHTNCPVCGLQYQVEPGFWYGAMYASYALTTGIVLVLGFGTYFLLNDPPLSTYLTIILSAIILSVPFTFRFSRNIYLHLFGGVDYQGNSPTRRVAD